MTAKFPKSFGLFIGILLLLLLAGYLWLAKIVPKSSPLPTRQELQNTAQEPQLPSITEWDEYRDPKYGFSLKHPKSWIPEVVQTATDYAVRFSEGGNALTVKVYPNSKQAEIVQALKAKSARGLFPTVEVTSVTLTDNSQVPAFYNYSTPRGDANMSSAVVERNNTVFVVELLRSIESPDYQPAFPLFVRSFQS